MYAYGAKTYAGGAKKYAYGAKFYAYGAAWKLTRAVYLDWTLGLQVSWRREKIPSPPALS